MVTGSSLVLVVDDEPLLCNVLQRILTDDGYKVITASNGEAFGLFPSVVAQSWYPVIRCSSTTD